MDQKELIDVFEDTKTILRDKKYPTKSTTYKCRVENINPAYRWEQKGHDTKVFTVNSDSITAARVFASMGRTCVLNMASSRRAGGGVANGARAQEECLFRASNLFEAIPQDDRYPLAHDECLYTRDALFFKDGTYKPIVTPFTVDVVSVAAINLNPNGNALEYSEYERENYGLVTREKMRLMFYLAGLNGCVNLVLGAWGCGVFQNDPRVIAEEFRGIVEEYQGHFENVVFAVINDHNSVGNNFQVFAEAFPLGNNQVG